MDKTTLIREFKRAFAVIMGITVIGSVSLSNAAEKNETTLYDFSFKNLMGGEEFPLSQFKGKVVMVVNTASKCNLTGQYESLEKIYEKYKDQGFVIIGVPSNDFGGQEPGNNSEISVFCELNYGVTFPMTQKEVVSGSGRHPFFKWANDVNGWVSGPKWNFHKYLFDKDGHASTYFYSTTSPDASNVTHVIEKLLAKK